MTWATVDAQLATIVEGTTGLDEPGSHRSAFKRAPKWDPADDATLPAGSRRWQFEVLRSAKLYSYRRRYRVSGRLLVSYDVDASFVDLQNRMLADSKELRDRLKDTTLWGRPSSTIHALIVGTADDHPATFRARAGGGRVMAIEFQIEHEVAA